MRRISFFLLFLLPLNMTAQQPDDPIPFACDSTKAVCLRAGWDTNGDGELNYREAAAVTKMDSVFSFQQHISSFNELRYFTGLKCLGIRSLADVYDLRSVTLPSTLEVIDKRAFWSCVNLRHINLPPGLREMREACFYHCERLEDITIPSQVDTVPELAFMWCTNLKTVVLEEGVRYIKHDAFIHCFSLSQLTLPSTLERVETRAFGTCRNLCTISCHATKPPRLDPDLLNSFVYKNAVVFIPIGSLEAYRADPGWKHFRNITEIF